jgi:CubicO group peptidase (beta-lactamase class C family)
MKLVEDGIFAPVGMTSSTFIVSDALRPWLSVGYTRAQGQLSSDAPTREHLGRGFKVPNGGVYSTVTDLARFLGALSGARPSMTSDSMRRAMLTKQTPEPRAGGYGLGLQISVTDGAADIVGHGGSVAGYNAHLAFDPVSRIGVIILRNYDFGRTNLGAAANQLVRSLASAAR